MTTPSDAKPLAKYDTSEQQPDEARCDPLAGEIEPQAFHV